MIQIGNFILVKQPDDKVWISLADCGEGGQFDASELEKILAEFYIRNF